MIFLRDRLFNKKSILDGVFNTILPAVLIVCLSLFNAPVCQADDDVVILEDVNKIIASAAEDAAEESAKSKPVESKPDSSSDVTVTNTSMPSDGAVFIGLGVAGLAALGLALGTSGSGDDGAPSAPQPAQVDPVGPSIAGTWSGKLVLIDNGTELVTATVVQNGEDVQITTSTTLPYGRYFSGTISRSGYMYMRDGTTGQTWTTFQERATGNSIHLWDVVNNVKDYDRLKLSR
jgi:hypothetical protein